MTTVLCQVNFVITGKLIHIFSFTTARNTGWHTFQECWFIIYSYITWRITLLPFLPNTFKLVMASYAVISREADEKVMRQTNKHLVIV